MHRVQNYNGFLLMPEISQAPDADPNEGLRERKRRETHQRIAEVGQRLFLTDGYDATTLDAIAAEAGISRRTFFSYFKSKDDIILYWQQADSAELFAELRASSPDMAPLDAVRDVMMRRIARYTSEQMTAVDKLMRSSESLLARKQAYYGQQEQALFETLCEIWRQPGRRSELRLVAMASIGAMRLALQAWREQDGERAPVAQFLGEAFERLKSGL